MITRNLRKTENLVREKLREHRRGALRETDEQRSLRVLKRKRKATERGWS